MRRPIATLPLATLLPLAATAQEPVLTPGENLVVQDIPPIPASLAQEVRRYTESRSAGFQDWHPTRRELLVGTRFGNVAQVHRVAMRMGARTQLTFLDKPVGGAVYDPRTRESFLFLKDVGGNEFDQIYRYDFAGGRITLLTDGGPSQNDGPVWNRAGDAEAEQIVARVQQNGTPEWYLRARDEGHGFAKKANQDFPFYATVMFIRQNLLREQSASR